MALETGSGSSCNRVLAAEKLVPDEPATRKLRESFAAADFKAAAEFPGIPAPRIVHIARAMAAVERAVVLAGASIVQTNSLEAVATANLLNWLLGAVGRAGGVLPPPEAPDPDLERTRPRFDDFLSRLDAAQLVLLDAVNPAYAVPHSVPGLEKAPALVSFAPFLDDSAAYADWILPDHAWLEREGVLVPPVSPMQAMNGSAALVQALHATRPLEQILVVERQGQGLLAAGPKRQPLIRSTGREREARLGVNQAPATAWAALAHVPELPGVEYRRNPAAQEVCPDAQDQVGFPNFINGQTSPTEG